jgi:cathepsin F
VGNLEGAYFRKLLEQNRSAEFVQLSEFELVECDTNDSGCSGGLFSHTLQFLQDSKLPMVPQSDYRYFVPETIFNPGCHEKRLKPHPLFTVKAWTLIGEKMGATNSEVEMARALVQYGPLAVALNAALMQFYFWGVQDPARWGPDDCNPESLNHGVTLVAYGTDAKSQKPFWRIKNSWGWFWGERGYYRLVRGSGACGINRFVATVTEIELTAVKADQEEKSIHI